MLKYFINNSSTEQIKSICLSLDNLKHRIQKGDYSNSYDEFNLCKQEFEELLEFAKSIKNEDLANAQYVFRQYFLVFCNLSSYFQMLESKEFRKSWDKLQDCMDTVKIVGKYVNMDRRIEIPDIYELLEDYEFLYPYKVFCSTEYIISKSHCSICGKSMQSLECSHIKGNLYWGNVAIEVIDKINEFQATCLVSHPEDKRCILELSDDVRKDTEKFKNLNDFLELGLPRLQRFSVKTKIETRVRKDIVKEKRNNPCPCGSGLKFKICCGKNMYYKHKRNIVTPQSHVILQKLCK